MQIPREEIQMGAQSNSSMANVALADMKAEVLQAIPGIQVLISDYIDQETGEFFKSLVVTRAPNGVDDKRIIELIGNVLAKYQTRVRDICAGVTMELAY